LKLAGKRKLVLSDCTRAKLKTIGLEMLTVESGSRPTAIVDCDYSRAEHQLADVLRPGDDVFADVVGVVDRHLGRGTAKKDLFVVDGASHYDLYDQPNTSTRPWKAPRLLQREPVARRRNAR
jgi:hypothetical protein